MPIATPDELLNALLSVTTPSEVRAILGSIGDRPDISPHEPFGPLNLEWHFYGDNESNQSTINLGSKPGRSLVERITNAIDAVLESRAIHHTRPLPRNPMEAAANWFGRPPTTHDNGLFTWQDEARTQQLNQMVRVVLTRGDIPANPTIDILDGGVGLKPTDFPDTILSLQKGNKLSKLYLTGTFGQGGSATLRFSDYTLIVSRSIQAPDTIGFTLIRLLTLGSNYKADAYVYLRFHESSGPRIPHFTSSAPLSIYHDISSAQSLKPLTNGTLVRHYGYSLKDYVGVLGPAHGNPYTLLNSLMFDPLLPFMVVDAREPAKLKARTITGSRNRLMRYVIGKESEEDDDQAETSVEPPVAAAKETGVRLRHHSPREMVSLVSGENPSVGIEYWVAVDYQKQGPSDQAKPRSQSLPLFVDPTRPIVGTLNGQNQGEMTSRILRDLGLLAVAKHTVIHIDVTGASKDVRNKLFSSTRESFCDGEVLSELTRILTNMLRDDAALKQIDQELMESITRREPATDAQEIKKQIASLLKSAGFRVHDPSGPESDKLVPAPDGPYKMPATSHTHRPARNVILAPLPTLPYPDVSSLKIVFPDQLSVPIGESYIVRIETDAAFTYDREGRIEIRSSPPKLEVSSKGMLTGGRMHWRLRPKEAAIAGDSGEVIVTLTRPGGEQLTAKIPYSVLPRREQPAMRERLPVPAFELEEVDPEQDEVKFTSVWGDVGQLPQEEIAYRAVGAPEGPVTIYYSSGFPPFRNQFARLATEPTKQALFRQYYLTWIGYHAMLQLQKRFTTRTSLGSQEDEQEANQSEERQRALVATIQVEQAMRMAELEIQARRLQSARE